MKKQKVTKEEEQAIFERARKNIEIGLGLELSLIELVELRSIWIPQVIADWEKIKNFGYNDFNMRTEVALRFISNNYTVDKKFLEDVFQGGIYPSKDSPERAYFKIKQDQMHLL